MSKRTPISPALREWILTTTRAGHGVDDVLQLMRNNGYDPRQSRSIIAEVLKMPLATLNATVDKAAAIRSEPGLRTTDPEPPWVDVDGQRVDVTIAVNAPVVRVLQGLLTPAECSALIELARPRMKRALTVGDDGAHQVDQRRTSNGTFFTLGETPLITTIETRLAKLFDMPAIHGEGLQILHYLPGQEYKPHFDWFDPRQPSFVPVTSSGGQRIASIVMYLNTPEKGGGTAFPEIGLTVAAHQGSAVYFAYEGGDQTSLHAGLPVVSGEKWIATKWLRERPYRGRNRG